MNFRCIILFHIELGFKLLMNNEAIISQLMYTASFQNDSKASPRYKVKRNWKYKRK